MAYRFKAIPTPDEHLRIFGSRSRRGGQGRPYPGRAPTAAPLCGPARRFSLGLPPSAPIASWITKRRRAWCLSAASAVGGASTRKTLASRHARRPRRGSRSHTPPAVPRQSGLANRPRADADRSRARPAEFVFIICHGARQGKMRYGCWPTSAHAGIPSAEASAEMARDAARAARRSALTRVV